MKKSLVLALVASLSLVACGKASDQSAVQVVEEKQPWADFVATVIDDYYRRNPESASDAGLHQYDGQMADMSMRALEDYAAWLDFVVAEAAGYTELQGIEAFERDYLSTSLRGRLFWLRDAEFPTKNPLFYTGSIGISVFIDREYAPLAQRMRAYTQYIEQVPGKMEQMKTNLRPPLPAPYVEMGYRILDGMLEYLST
ncbi:MAG: DUF885 domain-containing protein, partial [Gammaproteobacteria bacterium]|nr:DUF885 domain-containing protein [Gammaproteobacteria bacterium]